MKCEVCLSEGGISGSKNVLRTFDIPMERIQGLLRGVRFSCEESLSGIDLIFESEGELLKAKNILGDEVYATGFSSMEKIVGELLRKKGYRLSSAESCTAGLLSARLVNVPGSSEYFVGGVVCYSNQLKVSLLGVKLHTLERFGAVSHETCAEMLEGLKERFETECGVAITGIAGPGGSEHKPEGLTYVGVFLRDKVLIEERLFRSGRNPNRFLSTQVALNNLRKLLLEEEL